MKRITQKNKNIGTCMLMLVTGLLILASCTNKNRTITEDVSSSSSYSVEFSKGFSVNKTTDYTEVTVYNPWTKGNVLRRYILVDKNKNLPANLPEGTLIRTPLKRVISYSSVQCSVLSELNEIGSIIGVCEPEYVDIPVVQEGIKNGVIANLGMAANPDIEKIMLIEPEAILASPLKDASYGQAEKLGVPFIECVDYMESTPLGRAEWIRFHALFYGKEELADSLFRATVAAYNEIKALGEKAAHRPTVFTEMRYGNVWYISGGQSYTAHLLHDAGADYCWKDDPTTESTGYSFETVLNKAEKAEFWLIKYNKSTDMTYSDLANEYQLYSLFDAYKKKNIFTCNTGKNPYYEELPIHPDRVLKDMLRIFHPELLPGYQPRYYEKMKE